MKRSLGPQRWIPAKSCRAEPPPPPRGLAPLNEGPVFGPSLSTENPPTSSDASNPIENQKIKQYNRGSAKLAEQIARQSAESCKEHIEKHSRSDTTKGPYNSRVKTWSRIAEAAGCHEPFHLTTELIYTCMGALDRAGYRSAELYLDVAKQAHIEGRPWTQQLALAAKQAIRACQRGRGPSKQAQPLPLAEVAKLPDQQEPLVHGGPSYPIRSTVLVSWWLLREIEASAAEISHINIDMAAKLTHWRLPNSKADWKALGATRTHTCSCSAMQPTSLCPFHCMIAQVSWAESIKSQRLFPSTGGNETTKQGWADTFEEIAKKLNLKIQSPTGLRLFTGHSARATGAVHLAQTQVELWRIQLFGRWGSDCFKLYVRDAPLNQLHSLAQETSLPASLTSARAELGAILQATRHLQNQQAHSSIQDQPVAALMDCEAASPLASPITASAAESFVLNRAVNGKLHRIAEHSPTTPHHMWRTHCFWYFARFLADYELLGSNMTSAPKCAKCFKHLKHERGRVQLGQHVLSFFLLDGVMMRFASWTKIGTWLTRGSVLPWQSLTPKGWT